MKTLRPLLTALLAACAMSVVSGCASLNKVRGASVTVTTNPAEAAVTIDGKKAGVSPLTARLSASKAHLLFAAKDGAGTAAAILLPATKEQPARLFNVSPATGLSEATGFSPAAINLELKPTDPVDAYAVMVATVLQSDQLKTAGKLTAKEHAALNQKVTKLYSGK